MYAFDINLKNRVILNKFMEKFTPEQLNTIPKGFNNNLIWNIGHVVATQQLLVYGLSGNTPKVPAYVIDKYKKGTAPDGNASTEEITEIKSLLFSTLETLESDYNASLFTDFKEYTLSTTGGTLHSIEEAIEFNNFHEGLHLGSCLALSRLI